VRSDRIFKLGLKDNFWQMGDTGPCGPCSEIHYDQGPGASDLGHADCKFPCDCGRYVEIWNLVFMQYSRYCRYERDGYPAHWDEKARAEHKHSDDRYACLALDLLPKPCVDTGMGLERIAAVLEGKKSNYDTDLFQPLIDEAASLANVEYGSNHDTDVSLRIIADHARAATFLISDGVLPSNEGRGYVLRLIMRRALYHGQTLGLNEPFLYKMSGHVVQMMKDAYPELLETEAHVAKAVKVEEERYAHTTRVGLQRLDETYVTLSTGKEVKFRDWRSAYSSHKGDLTELVHSVSMRSTIKRAGVLVPQGFAGLIDGDRVFELHDTFGLRPDFVDDIVRNYGLTINRIEYDKAMSRQRERARWTWKATEKAVAEDVYSKAA